jgi:hypothetical protein
MKMDAKYKAVKQSRCMTRVIASTIRFQKPGFVVITFLSQQF